MGLGSVSLSNTTRFLERIVASCRVYPHHRYVSVWHPTDRFHRVHYRGLSSASSHLVFDTQGRSSPTAEAQRTRMIYRESIDRIPDHKTVRSFRSLSLFLGGSLHTFSLSARANSLLPFSVLLIVKWPGVGGRYIEEEKGGER